MTKKQKIYAQRIKKHLKNLEGNSEIDIDKITEGKSIEQLSYNSVTYNNFMKRKKRQEQQVILKKEVAKIDADMKKRVELKRKQNRMSYQRNKVTDKSKAIVKFTDMPFEPSKKNLKLKTQSEARNFFYSYFKELSLNNTEQKRIEKLASRFGRRLDLFYEFVDDRENLVFKYPTSKENMKRSGNDEYQEHMKERLSFMEKLLETKYGI